MFSETEYTLLASSYDNSILGDYQTLTRASKSLQDKTYDSSVITYSYITFERNGIILDDRSAYESHSNFYPGALEYEDVSREEWDAQNQIDGMTIKPAHVVKLKHSSYGNSYITVYQPYVNTAGRLCGAMTVLVKEKDIVSMFLSQQQWREEGLFCLISDDGTILAGNNYDGTTLSLTSDDTGWAVSYTHLDVYKRQTGIVLRFDPLFDAAVNSFIFCFWHGCFPQLVQTFVSVYRDCA